MLEINATYRKIYTAIRVGLLHPRLLCDAAGPGQPIDGLMRIGIYIHPSDPIAKWIKRSNYEIR